MGQALVWVCTPSGWRGPMVKGCEEARREQTEAEKHGPVRRKKRGRAVRRLRLDGHAAAPPAGRKTAKRALPL